MPGDLDQRFCVRRYFPLRTFFHGLITEADSPAKRCEGKALLQEADSVPDFFSWHRDLLNRALNKFRPLQSPNPYCNGPAHGSG